MTPMQTKITADFFRSLLPEEVKKTKKQIINHIEMSCQKYSKNTSLRLVISIAEKYFKMKIIKNNACSTEHKIVDLIGRGLLTKYNFSLVVITALWWMSACLFQYYNTNFDMLSTAGNYIMYLSLISISVGLTSNGNHYKHLAKLGVLSAILVVFTLSATKSVLTALLGEMWLVPISMFCFLLLLKNIWLVASFKDDSQHRIKNKENEQ